MRVHRIFFNFFLLTNKFYFLAFSQGLRFVLSPGPTSASKLYLTRRMKWATLEEKAKIEHVEVCPQAMKITADIAKRVGEDGGGALIVDYGDDSIVSDSLQVCFIVFVEFVKQFDLFCLYIHSEFSGAWRNMSEF